MKSKTKSIIQFVVVLALGILLVWVAYGQVADQKEKIIAAFTNADYFWVFISAMIGFFSHIVRAYRWKYLLEPLGYKTSFINASAAVFIGYFGNYAFRLGEIMRPSIMDRYEKVPFQIGFGTVITERIVDFILLLVIFGLTLLFQFSELIGLSNKYIFDPMGEKFSSMSATKGIIICVAVIGFISVLLAFRKTIAGKLKGKFGSVIKGFLDGISSVRKIKNMWAFIGLSVLIWALYFYCSYACFFALTETSTLGHKECLTIMLLGTLGIVFTPGGLGAYHLIVANVLIFYGLDKAEAATFPWLVWTSQLIVVTFMGLLSMALLPIINKNKNVVQQ